MDKTIAVRIESSLHEALEERARLTGTTVSQVVRDTLRDALAERPHSARLGELKGTLQIREDEDAWRRDLRKRNWRP